MEKGSTAVQVHKVSPVAFIAQMDEKGAVTLKSPLRGAVKVSNLNILHLKSIAFNKTSS